MNYAPYGSLFHHIRRMDNFQEATLQVIMMQLILAVDFMHKKGIIHRDLKPDNILVLDREKSEVCIADLGLACAIDDYSNLVKKLGTPGYLAPEILKGFSASPKSDIFSLGAIFYNIVTGNMLFNGKDEKEVLRKNRYKDPSEIIDEDLLTISTDC